MRLLLKIILKFLAKKAIKKHEIEIIVVSGWVGVELVKEGIYTLLSDKFIVRRNTTPVWWDLSIPLNILGYKDIRRSFIGWVKLIFSAIYTLRFGSKNKSILILTAESEKENTAKYWSSIINPDFLVIVNNKQDSFVTNELINSTQKAGIIVFDSSEFTKKFPNSFIYGADKEATVNYTENNDVLEINYMDKSIVIPKYYMPSFAQKIIASIVSLSLAKGMSIDDVINGLLKFDLRNMILTKVSKNIQNDK